jgi:hypothetical protein
VRFARGFQILSILLLVCALFGGEVVESACFVNHVSNDYIQAPASPAHQFANKAFENVIPHNSKNVADESVLKLTVAASIGPAPSSASDLLRLLSIQRT